MLWVFYRPAIKVTGGISDVFVYFFVQFETVLPAFFGAGDVFGFEIIKKVSDMQQLSCLG